MDLHATLLSEHSKANCDKIVKWVGKDPHRFNELFGLFIADEYAVAQRAAWPLSYIVQAHPFLIQKQFDKLMENVQQTGRPDAVKRNTFRLLQNVAIPEHHQGTVMNLCFEAVLSPAEKPAVKAFALTVLEQLSLLHPAIKQEIKTIIEDRWAFESAAFRSRASKMMK